MDEQKDTSQKVIGWVTTKTLTFSGGTVFPSKTYEVVAIWAARGHTFYVTNHLMDDGQHLMIVDTIAESYRAVDPA